MTLSTLSPLLREKERITPRESTKQQDDADDNDDKVINVSTNGTADIQQKENGDATNDGGNGNAHQKPVTSTKSDYGPNTTKLETSQINPSSDSNHNFNNNYNGNDADSDVIVPTDICINDDVTMAAVLLNNCNRLHIIEIITSSEEDSSM